MQFTAQSERDFFLDIRQKQLNFVVFHLRLTDSKNRLIGRRNTGSDTATATGTRQSILGNLNFSAVLRFDIVKNKNVDHLKSQHHEPNIPALAFPKAMFQLKCQIVSTTLHAEMFCGVVE